MASKFPTYSFPNTAVMPPPGSTHYILYYGEDTPRIVSVEGGTPVVAEEEPEEHACNCTMTTLMRAGCKCGGK